MRKCTALLFAACIGLTAPAFAADPPASPSDSPPAAAQALSPNVQSAIAELSSDNFKTRENALKKLQIALGEQMRTLVSSEDPEVQSRLTALLQFNDGLTRWILETYKLPADQRQAEINFGLQPDILPILGQVFSADTDERVEGIHALAKIKKPEVAHLLGRMLDDPERAVYVAAMEAVWDCKPNDAIVNALWDRAVDAGLMGYRNNVAQQPAVKFRGRNIGGVTFADNSFMRRGQDSGIACEVLIHLNAPEVAAKIKLFLEGFEKATDGTNPNANVWMYTSNSESMKNAFHLIEAYKTREAVAILYKVATAPARQKSQGQMNTEKYFWSNRTTALASLITVIGQKPEDYELKRQRFLGDIWSAPSEADEDKAVKKIQEWWAANSDKFAAGKTDQTGAPKPETPASQPAAENPDNKIQPPAALNQINGTIRIQGHARIQIAPAPDNP